MIFILELTLSIILKLLLKKKYIEIGMNCHVGTNCLWIRFKVAINHVCAQNSRLELKKNITHFYMITIRTPYTLQLFSFYETFPSSCMVQISQGFFTWQEVYDLSKAILAFNIS